MPRTLDDKFFFRTDGVVAVISVAGSAIQAWAWAHRRLPLKRHQVRNLAQHETVRALLQAGAIAGEAWLVRITAGGTVAELVHDACSLHPRRRRAK